jgi:hypothetical protein
MKLIAISYQLSAISDQRSAREKAARLLTLRAVIEMNSINGLNCFSFLLKAES